MKVKKYYLVPNIQPWGYFYQGGVCISITGIGDSCGFMLVYTNKRKAEVIAKRMKLDISEIITVEKIEQKTEHGVVNERRIE